MIQKLVIKNKDKQEDKYTIQEDFKQELSDIKYYGLKCDIYETKRSKNILLINFFYRKDSIVSELMNLLLDNFVQFQLSSDYVEPQIKIDLDSIELNTLWNLSEIIKKA